MSASPNPAASYINVHMEAAGAVQLIITDVYGIKRLQVPVSSSDQRVPVAILNTGTYLLQLADRNNNIIAATKFIKQ